MNSFFKTWKEGQKLKLEVRKSDMDRAVMEVDRSSNRLVLGFIIGAIIVSNALIIHAKVPPLIFGIPALAYFGAFLIIWLGILLTISILRKASIPAKSNKGGNETSVSNHFFETKGGNIKWNKRK